MARNRNAEAYAASFLPGERKRKTTNPNAKEHVCAYSDCIEVDCPIIVTDKRGLTQERFCCLDHAAECLFARAQRQKREQRDVVGA